MKTRAVVYVKALRLSAATMLATAFLCANTWAGQVSQKPTARTPPPTSHGRGEYRLVFPTGYEVKSRGAARDESRDSKFDNFVERLNEAGAEGYRLNSFVYDGAGLPVGLVGKAGAVYEYKWFYTDAKGVGSNVTVDFDKKYPALSEQGFRLADYSRFENYCDLLNTSETGPYTQECHDAYVFLFEREKGVARPARHTLAALIVSGSETSLVTDVKRILADGLAPKHALPGYRFWFEPSGTSDVRWSGVDIEVISRAGESPWRRSPFKKNINELAQRGYRVAMLDWGVALMYRARGDAAVYSYVWVKADGGLERRLAQLQARGAVYLKTYQKEDDLVFEQSTVDDGARHEYKALRFKFDKTKDTAGRQVRVALAPSSAETLKALERFVGEGFAVRDLFLSGGQIGAILERPR